LQIGIVALKNLHDLAGRKDAVMAKFDAARLEEFLKPVNGRGFGDDLLVLNV